MGMFRKIYLQFTAFSYFLGMAIDCGCRNSSYKDDNNGCCSSSSDIASVSGFRLFLFNGRFLEIFLYNLDINST